MTFSPYWSRLRNFAAFLMTASYLPSALASLNASMATQVLQTVITLLAPVFVPPEALLVPLQAASLVWPTTHAALALRAAMAGEAVAAYWPSLAVLAALAVVSLALVPLKLEWRST